jgi:hypothetical protein
VTAQNQYVPADRATSGETPALPGDELSHLAIPVRFGRRKTDQVGHLIFAGRSLLFHGTVDMRISWSEVSRIDHTGRDLVVAFHGTQRTMRFCCQSDEEAMQAGVLGAHLAAIAGSDPYQPAGV